jgi:arginyl-tRNA synthetase
MPFVELREELAHRIAQHWNHPDITPAQILSELSLPPNPAMGHVALPCFRLAKTLGKQNIEIAKALEAAFHGKDGITAKAAGPYANFKWPVAALFSETLRRIHTEKNRYGQDSSGSGQKVLIEYCSPNIAKKLAFQHIRSTLIGNVLSNVYERLGYTTIRVNFVGDWGSQFARLLAAVEMWGDASVLNGASNALAMNHLFELYVRFHKEAEKEPAFNELGSKWLQRLEKNDPKATELWKRIRELSLAAVQTTLQRMQVRFDHIEGESVYIPGMDKTLDFVKKAAGARISEGAWIVDVEGIEVPALIQKKDGTTLYLTRDIAAAADRHQRFDCTKMLYIVSEQQKLHFQLLFGVLKKMGMQWAEGCEHVSFGTVLFGAEKMSTREGRVFFLDDILEEAKTRALAICSQKNPDLANKEAVAEMVGIGAVIFGNLSAHRQRDIDFDWEQILAFDGETGPYVQYSLVRCYSLLEKAADALGTDIDFAGYEFALEEELVVLWLSRYRSALRQVVHENDPFALPRYLIELAKAFNRFYYRFPVLQANDPVQRRLRVSLVDATRQVLENGLQLLGIQAPREM